MGAKRDAMFLADQAGYWVAENSMIMKITFHASFLRSIECMVGILPRVELLSKLESVFANPATALTSEFAQYFQPSVVISTMITISSQQQNPASETSFLVVIPYLLGFSTRWLYCHPIFRLHVSLFCLHYGC